MTEIQQRLPFSVPEGILTYTPVYSNLAIILAEHDLIYHWLKLQNAKRNQKILHTYIQHCLNSKVKMLFPH